MWLLLEQRLRGAAPLEEVVLDVLRDLPDSFWPRPCKRIRDWREKGIPLSGNTAAYDEARQRLPLAVVEQSCDRIFERLTARLRDVGGHSGRPAFGLDGTSVRMAYSPALAESFPRASNQNGESHWPVMRVLVAHDLETGLALRPEFGPMYGGDAVSEQGLLESAIGRLPPGAAVVGDRNFGVFSVAWTVAQKQCQPVLRLTADRARRLAGGSLKEDMDLTVTWEPSRADRKTHPELPPDAAVEGRLIARRVQPDNGGQPFVLYLFTTLTEPAEEILPLYGQRWRIETDLRTLKTQLRMEQLSCASPEMAAKEIEMGMGAYNLVRAMICLAAAQSGLAARGFSFTRAARIVQSFAPLIANSSPPEAKRHFDRMMYFLKQAKLPKRKSKRKAYPRAVWGIRDSFPKRKNR